MASKKLVNKIRGETNYMDKELEKIDETERAL